MTFGVRRELDDLKRFVKGMKKQLEGIMTAMQDLKVVAGEIAADAAAAHEQITIALDFIVKKVDDTEIVAAVDVLRAAHMSLTEDLGALKAKVDEVMASGGDA